MASRFFVVLTLLVSLTSPAFAAPGLHVVPQGLQSGNWVWQIDIEPDFSLAPGGTPLALELGFRLTGSPLASVTNINPLEWDTPNPGNVIFGWEMLTDVDPGAGVNLRPVGLQSNATTYEIFAAFGSDVFTTPGPKPFLEIVALGPGNGGGPQSTIEWLGAYGGNGRIAQLVPPPPPSASFDIYPGTATQVIPEPATVALAAPLAVVFVAAFRRRRW
jgi:hypothetical protein